MKSVVDALEERVRSRGRAPALEDEAGLLTYEELWSEARRWAAALEELPRGSRVTLEFKRGPEWILGMVACWMRGLVAIPLDPHDVSQRGLAQADPALRLKAAPRGGKATVPVALTEQDPAYVCFTSGSSGRPKGVLVGHRGLLPMLSHQVATFGLGPDSRSLWVLNPYFDASVSDVFTVLLAGGTLVFPERSAPPLPEPQFLDYLEQKRITYLDLPPSVLARWPVRPPECLKTLVVGGEVVPPETVRSWSRELDLFVVYGPTETTVCASIARGHPQWQEPFLGTPVPGLGFECQGEELVIVGRGVALGYLNQTDSRFHQRNGRPAYSTGDRVKPGWIFAGRMDRQFQYRGTRVEPTEVEHLLLACPGVVGARLDPDMRARVEGTATVEELRRWAGRHLPKHLRPRHYSVGELRRDRRRKLAEDPLAEAWTEALGTPPGEFQGDSLDLVAYLAAANRRGLPLTVEVVHRYPRFEEQRRALHGAGSWRSTQELETAPPKLRTGAPGPVKTVLVTGSTGGLGRALVPLLRQRYRVLEFGRTAEIRGDLAKPQLGLEKGVWNQLAEQLDAIFHLAALTHLSLPFETIAEVNVRGTQQLLELAGSGKPKRFYHASTLGVFLFAEPCPRVLTDETPLEAVSQVYGGYAQSKWAAEKLVLSSGCWHQIYRLGLLSDHSLQLRRLLGEEGVVLDNRSPWRVDLTPNTFAAEAIVKLSAGGQGVYNICNPHGTLGLRPPAEPEDPFNRLTLGYRLADRSHLRAWDVLAASGVELVCSPALAGLECPRPEEVWHELKAQATPASV